MENLLASLERILDVWRQDREELLGLVQPGLTEQEFQDCVSNLSFEVPQEVQCLYRWRNGIKIPKFYDLSLDFLPGFWFLSLADMVKECQKLEEFRRDYTFLQDEHCGEPWFPIFRSDISGYFIVFGNDDVYEASPVHYLSWHGGDFINREQYPSLTMMIAVIAECYESGAYYLETEVMDSFGTTAEFLREDQKKVNRIRRKYA